MVASFSTWTMFQQIWASPSKKLRVSILYVDSSKDFITALTDF